MKNVDRLPLSHIKARYLLAIVAFISFALFQGPLSYFVFIFSVVNILGSFCYENCKIFYIKSKNNQFITSQFLTKIVESVSYILYLVLFWFISKTFFAFCIMSFFSQHSGFLSSYYFEGICLISSSIVVTLLFWIFHTLVLKELQKESYQKEKGI